MKYQNNGEKRSHKTKLSVGAFGQNNDRKLYSTLKVLPKHRQAPDNVNVCGVANTNHFKMTEEEIIKLQNQAKETGKSMILCYQKEEK